MIWEYRVCNEAGNRRYSSARWLIRSYILVTNLSDGRYSLYEIVSIERKFDGVPMTYLDMHSGRVVKWEIVFCHISWSTTVGIGIILSFL